VDRALGGAATYFAVAASFFTACESRRHRKATIFTSEDERIFRGRHIDTDGLERAEGQNVFLGRRYSQDLNERVTLTTN